MSSIPESERYSTAGIVRHRPFNGSSLLVRRSASPRFPTWAPQAAEDLIYLLELAPRGRCVLVPEPLVGYRRHENSHRGRTADLELKRFRFVMSWLARRNDIPDRERKAITESALFWMLREARKARQKRDFDSFDRIIAELKSFQYDVQVRELIKKGRYPAFMYSVHDFAKTIARSWWRTGA